MLDDFEARVERSVWFLALRVFETLCAHTEFFVALERPLRKLFASVEIHLLDKLYLLLGFGRAERGLRDVGQMRLQEQTVFG